MFMLGAYPAPVLRWRQGPVMSGFLTFMDRYRDEAACIAALAELRWPNGFICARCAGRLAYQLAARPRVFECADCGRQHSVTAARAGPGLCQSGAGGAAAGGVGSGDDRSDWRREGGTNARVADPTSPVGFRRTGMFRADSGTLDYWESEPEAG